MTSSLTRKLVAEAIGTFILVFAGTGAIVVNDVRGGPITHVGVALVFGLVVMTMIYAIGDLSGAHMNPAVSLGFVLAGRFPARRLLPYAVAQTTGALAASAVLRLLFDHATLGATRPAGPPAQAFVMELILTAILMFVVLAVSSGPKEKGVMAGIAIGGLIGLEAMFAGPVTGASMNPVRSLAPAVISGDLCHLWIYLIAPPLGAAAMAPLHAWLMRPDAPGATPAL
ncbi:MAG TPA: aquaporin [Tepidisphaeraceae bacterium]|nr:aquaporin [Tepidisphaeraceae bacterium]